MTLVFGSDHAGYELRKRLVDHAVSFGHTCIQVGAPSEDSFDYPVAADEAVEKLLGGDATLGVLICGTGNGMSIRANRNAGIRAAVCCSPKAAELARQHNQANVLCIGARLTSLEDAKLILTAFLHAQPDLAERHQRRVEQLDDPI